MAKDEEDLIFFTNEHDKLTCDILVVGSMAEQLEHWNYDLQTMRSIPTVLLIAGDFNFHIDDTTDTAAANFLSLLESFDLQQHVRSCTHRAGHTLDLVITRDAEYILNGISVDDSSEISDHYTVCADLRFVKPNWERKRICGRKLKAINLEHF